LFTQAFQWSAPSAVSHRRPLPCVSTVASRKYQQLLSFPHVFSHPGSPRWNRAWYWVRCGVASTRSHVCGRRPPPPPPYVWRRVTGAKRPVKVAVSWSGCLLGCCQGKRARPDRCPIAGNHRGEGKHCLMSKLRPHIPAHYSPRWRHVYEERRNHGMTVFHRCQPEIQTVFVPAR